ncbi:hypothetical protein OGAPHI_003136 [Ogataea philodendri]|uniref:Uncharacterized protein n=1 Tax=Ogataea philodendri TaxID=1378263 RepID=A0A9P8P8U0_9ASCO|nr:uncharacterized protein OGAPHI_003136 [Ogataea philodendri]KAH3667487.1 hypothetical protein OGAPHI_003136 [Ogataea philodendri]
MVSIVDFHQLQQIVREILVHQNLYEPVRVVRLVCGNEPHQQVADRWRVRHKVQKLVCDQRRLLLEPNKVHQSVDVGRGDAVDQLEEIVEQSDVVALLECKLIRVRRLRRPVGLCLTLVVAMRHLGSLEELVHVSVQEPCPELFQEIGLA